MRGFSRQRLILLPLIACACHTWSPITLNPTQSGTLAPHIRVVRTDGKTTELDGGLVKPDSIAGTRRNGDYIAVPRDSVLRVEEPHFNVGRTLALGVSMSGLAAVIGAALATMRD